MTRFGGFFVAKERSVRLLVALIFVTGSVMAADPVVDFKGVPMGASESVFKARNPEFGCWPVPKPSFLGERGCKNSKTEFGGANATIQAFFYSDRLLFATVHLKTGDFDDVVGALKLKFGEPTIRYENITTRLGLKLTNENVEWRVGRVVIDGWRYTGDIDTASVSYHHDDSIGEHIRRRDEHIKAGAKSL